MKRCNHCLAYKYLSAFYKNKSSHDGLQPRCKICCSIFGKSSYNRHKEKFQAKRSTPAFKAQASVYHAKYYQEHREEFRLYDRQYRLQHPGISDKRKAYLLEHQEERKQYLARYHVNDRPRQRERERVWRANNQERNRLRSLRRRSREFQAPGEFTEQQVAMRIAYYGHQCAYCHGPYETIDHVIPLARGGTNWPSNLRPSCRKCNEKKGTRFLHEWQR